jgi:site-specific DNA recombinase
MATKHDAVIYCRVSTKEQAENFSLETQEDACRTYCEKHGFQVLAVFAEAESAKSVDRAQFQAMQDFCLKYRKQVAVLVVYNVSRFSRVTSDHLTVRLLLQKLGIELRSVMEGIDSTPTGRFTETIMSAYAQLDNELRAMRTKEGMTAAVKAGNFVHRAPLGYVNADVPGGLTKDPSTAELIRTIFEMFASGESKAEILARVTELGLRSPQTGSEISSQFLDKILSNPAYGGIVSIPKWGLQVQGKFEPILDPELYARVKARLSNGQPQAVSDVSEEFPLRVFVRCSDCGQGITGSFATGRRGGKYPYYYCRVKNCRAVKFKRIDLEVKFLTLLDSLRFDEKFGPLLKEAVRAVWNQKHSQRENQLAQARKRVAELQAWREQIIKAWIAEKITQEVYDDQMQKVGTELQAAGLLEGEAVLDLAEVELLLDFADWMLSHAASVWASASWANKIRIQRAIFPAGLVVSSEGFGTPEEQCAFLRLQENSGDEYDMASPGGFEPPLPP